MNTLKVSEIFYSLQGEGLSAGFPAVFLRLQGCVLSCKWCDTTEVWKQGSPKTFVEIESLIGRMVENGGALPNVPYTLVVTGGDPLIQTHSLMEFLAHIRSSNGHRPHRVEIETEGVLFPRPRELMYYTVDQWNVSPKLSNSGMPDSLCWKPDVLREMLDRGKNLVFKFVVGSEADLSEALLKVTELRKWAPRSKPVSFCLMPLASNRADYLEVAPKVAEWCKQYGFVFSPRLHLMLWDRATGV